MRKNYFTLLCIILTSCLFSQNNDFNNQGGDFIWSNPSNWSLGVVPNTTNTEQVRLPLLVQSQVDTDISIKKIQTIFGTANANPSSIVPVAGTGILTINAGTANGEGIFNPSNHDAKLTFRGNVVINNSAGAGAFTFMRNANGSGSTIEFDNGSLLTLNSNLGTTTPNSNISGFIFNGTIDGNANLRVSDNTSVIFGSTSSNPNWGGQLVFQGNASAIVNAADNNSFYKGTTGATRLQVNGNNSSIELNGANIFEAGITIAASHAFTFKVNRNQNGVRNIIFSNNGTLNLEVGEEVTNLSFINNSSVNWNAGTLNITGFKNGVIRFGTDNSGLTSAQLSQITVDDGSEGLVLDSNGYLYSYNTSWTGAMSPFWGVPGNWSHGVPAATDNVYIPDVLNAPIIAATLQITVNDLNIDEPDAIQINSGGVLIVNGYSTGNIRSLRELPTSNWYLVSSPVSGQVYNDAYVTNNNIASGEGNNNRGIASYTTTTNTWSYLQAGAAGNFNNGQGYSVKRNNAGIISFAGTINTADVSVAVSNAGSGFNLIGNPFTAHFDSASFLTDNSANLVSQTIWVWNQDTNNYETYVTADDFKLAPAQGFFVRSGNGNSLNLAKSYQELSGGTFQRSEKTEVKLMITDGSSERLAKIYYLDNATTGFDNGFDGETFGGISNSFDVFTHLVSNDEGKRYQVQSLPNSDFENTVVPVGLKASAGQNITFSAEVMNLPDGINVYLEDTTTNSFTLLGDTNTTYNLTLNEPLNGAGRFYLHTKSPSTLSNDVVFLENTSAFLINNNTLRLTGLPTGKSNITLFNILGKEVMQSTFNSNGSHDINLPKLSTGIYIVQLETVLGNLNKKLIIR